MKWKCIKALKWKCEFIMILAPVCAAHAFICWIKLCLNRVQTQWTTYNNKSHLEKQAVLGLEMENVCTLGDSGDV